MLVELIFKNRFETKKVLNLIRWTIIIYTIITFTFYLIGMALNPDEYAFINRATGPYAWAYWIMFFGALILPLTLLIKKLASKFWYVILVAFGMKSGMYFERFVIITTSVHRDYPDINGNTGFIETGLTSGNYDFTITDSKGCIITSTLEIIDNSEMKSVHSPDPVCEGGIATLEVEQLTGFNYLWFYNGNSIPGATNHIYSTPAAGNYWVQVSSSSCGKFLSDTMQVIVNTVENVSVSASPTICPPQSATLNASGGISYEWLPKTNINFTDVPDPLVNPGKTTVYSVKITDDNGCFKTLTVPVLVMCDSLLIPTGFSPNNDGINDGYVIENIDLFPGNQIWVFNSLGSLVFNQKNYDNKWDGRANAKGTFNGKYAPQGTYFYILDLADGSTPRSGYIIIRR